MKAREFIGELERYNLGPYIEVPCSILGPIISELLKEKSRDVLNPANEAVAMGLAAGSYLATVKIPVLLMQNSGLCNVLNALTSLNQIYHIPTLYIISWRGEPAVKDAPEHYVMGRKTEKLLEAVDVPYCVLSEKHFKKDIQDIVAIIRKTKNPGAIVLRKGLIEKEETVLSGAKAGITRSRAVDLITKLCRDKACFISTNGFISREAFASINKRGMEESIPAFYMLGSMGHALPIGMGVARSLPHKRKVVVLDGDGGCLMHLGAMASIGREKVQNLIHVVLDNGVYASTGRQPTISQDIDFCLVAKGCGYKNIHRFSSEKRLLDKFTTLLEKKGPTFMHILINDAKDAKKTRVSDAYSCDEIKENFMRGINGKR